MSQKQVLGTLTCCLFALVGCGGHTVNPIGGGPRAGAPSIAGASGSDESGGAGGALRPGHAGGPVGGAGSASAGAGHGGASTSSGAGSAGQGLEPSRFAELAGTWTGYVENFKFSDLSDAVTLVLERDGTGELSFGNSPPPAPATDPDVGYPTEGPSLDYSPTAGFRFSVRNASGAGSRLQFDVAVTEVWMHWCELQTPIPDEANLGLYGCIHNWGYRQSGGSCSQQNPMTKEVITVDCRKLELCQNGVCACSDQACSAALDDSVHFDLNLDVPKANGSVAGLGGSVRNVHLTRN